MTITTHSTGTSGPAAAEADAAGLPWIEDAGKIAPQDARELSRLFFDQLAVLEEGTHAYQYARNTLIEMNQSLVRFAARRFRNRGNGDMEDILQVGTIGLIKAIDRFDLTREAEFTSFAIPYIVGEIKRYFRDSTWAVHVPRRLQELRVDLARAKERLAVELDRDPGVKELAAELDISEEEVIDGLIAANGYMSDSLDLPADSTTSGKPDQKTATTYADFLGDWDPAMELVENFTALRPLLGTLDDRERYLLELRFGQELTQAQIGAELGVSQMHVSRLLSRTLGKLREGLLSEG